MKNGRAEIETRRGRPRCLMRAPFNLRFAAVFIAVRAHRGPLLPQKRVCESAALNTAAGPPIHIAMMRLLSHPPLASDGRASECSKLAGNKHQSAALWHPAEDRGRCGGCRLVPRCCRRRRRPRFDCRLLLPFQLLSQFLLLLTPHRRFWLHSRITATRAGLWTAGK
jgi:hypothetical protein